MGRASREKGKAGEREFAAFLRSHGIEARRGVQYAGGGDSPDVVHGLDGVHFEVKRVERLSLWPSLEQAMQDAGGNVPVVAHRSNKREWVVVLRAEDFLTLVSGG